jgi:hypothetical protein
MTAQETKEEMLTCPPTPTVRFKIWLKLTFGLMRGFQELWQHLHLQVGGDDDSVQWPETACRGNEKTINLQVFLKLIQKSSFSCKGYVPRSTGFLKLQTAVNKTKQNKNLYIHFFPVYTYLWLGLIYKPGKIRYFNNN